MISHFVQCFLKWDSLVLACTTGCLCKDPITRAFRCISKSADGQIYPALLVGLALLQPECWRILAACILSFAVELGAYKFIKESVKRPRPCQQFHGWESLIRPPDVFSFPSGHTAGAFVMASLLAFCYPAAGIPAYVWAALVGFSRVALRVHYPTDVLAGAGLGLLSARAGWLITSSMAFFNPI